MGGQLKDDSSPASRSGGHHDHTSVRASSALWAMQHPTGGHSPQLCHGDLQFVFQGCWAFPTRAGSTMRLRWKDTSSILQFGLCWAAVSARCCVPRVAPCQVSRSWLCRSLPCRGSTPTCSVFFSCGVCAFLSPCLLALAGVAVHSTALAITAQVARGRGCLGDVAMRGNLQLPRCAAKQEHESVLALDARRIEVIAEGLPAFHGAQLAIDTLVSPLRADGEPHRRCSDVDARTYPELSGDQGRDKLIVLAGETGGQFSVEKQTFIRLFARAKTRSVREPLRTRARQSWAHGGGWRRPLRC